MKRDMSNSLVTKHNFIIAFKWLAIWYTSYKKSGEKFLTIRFFNRQWHPNLNKKVIK